MSKKNIVCFLDLETNHLVSWNTIRDSWRENIESGGIDDCTFAQYVLMITDLSLGSCVPVYSLSDVAVLDFTDTRYYHDSPAQRFQNTFVSFRDELTDDELTEYRDATVEDIQ